LSPSDHPMTIAAIVVTDTRNAIGKDNRLLCHLPADLKFFKSTTMGFPIIMGRKTYESVGRLLPGRRNLVITRSSDYRVEGAEIYHHIDKALASCSEEMVFIIGGAEIFRQSMHHIQVIYRTLIRHEFEADTWFPPFEKDFTMASQECFAADARNPYDYCFEKWVRRVS
jgi:dihydrofolate reductase